MDKPSHCGNCREAVDEESLFCPHCGVLFEKAPVTMCSWHRDREACGVCIICHRYVCERCSVALGNRSFCTDHRDVEVEEDWARVFQSDQMLLCGAVEGMLNAELSPGTDAADPRSAIAQRWITHGARTHKVFVPLAYYDRAVALIRDWQSGEKLTEEQGS